MPRFVALLRGVSPMNLRMGDLKLSLESSGFTAVKTLLSSGNAAFDTRATSTSIPALEKKIESALARDLGKGFLTLVRPQAYLADMIAADPFRGLRFPSGAKRVVTFLRERPQDKLRLPLELDGARILAVEGREVFTAYLPSPKSPVFMSLLEKTFGKVTTTRTWDTVRKCAAA